MLRAAGEYVRSTSASPAQKLASFIGLPPGIDPKGDNFDDMGVQNDEFKRRAQARVHLLLSFILVETETMSLFPHIDFHSDIFL